VTRVLARLLCLVLGLGVTLASAQPPAQAEKPVPGAAAAQKPVPNAAAPVAGQPAAPIIPAPPEIAAKAWILMDAKSGKVLVERNADERLAPASLTKMMTGYVLSEAVRSGKVKWEDTAHISHNAWAQNPLFVGSSLMWVDVDSDVSLRDLNYGLVISSGNDASVAIAEHLAGS